MADSIKPTVRVPANMNGPAFTSDGLINAVARIGAPGDKAAYARYGVTYFSQYDADAAYRTSWFRKICDIPPNDEVREWRTWTGADEDQITLIDKEEKRLDLRRKISEARILARKDGGSVIVLGLKDNPGSPLNFDRVTQGGLQFITVLSRAEVTPIDIERDAMQPNFGRPKSYRLSGTQTIVDASRVIHFRGNPRREQMSVSAWDGWDDSVWMEIREKVMQSDQIAAAVASLVDEAKIDVFRISGFMSGLATDEYEDRLVRRWGALNTAKSTVNALLLDAADEYEQKTLTFAGLSDLQDRAMTLLAGIADIPATRLFGRAPQGMNATGDSDMRNYYDRVRAGQIMYLQPSLEPLDECLIRSALGTRDDEIYYEWNPLYSLSETEAATIEKTFADAANVYATSALIPDTALAEIVKQGIIERGQWPGSQQAFESAEAEGDLPGLLEEPTEAEQAAEAAKTAVAMAQAKDPTGFGSSNKKLVAANDARFQDASPRTLYVRRDVVNVADIQKWAKGQGLVAQDGLHVTVAHSDTPVDWIRIGSSWSAKLEIPEGGPRIVDHLGKYIVLLFASDELNWRHSAMLERGAEDKWPDYQPHISIMVDESQAMNLTEIKPYIGKIVLGPEIFEEVKTDDELAAIRGEK